MSVSSFIESSSECQNRKWLLWLANSEDVLLTREGILYASDPKAAADFMRVDYLFGYVCYCLVDKTGFCKKFINVGVVV